MTTLDPRPELEGESDPQRPLDEATEDELGEQLGLAAEHMRGMHVEPRAACWRCRRALQEAEAALSS